MFADDVDDTRTSRTVMLPYRHQVLVRTLLPYLFISFSQALITDLPKNKRQQTIYLFLDVGELQMGSSLGQRDVLTGRTRSGVEDAILGIINVRSLHLEVTTKRLLGFQTEENNNTTQQDKSPLECEHTLHGENKVVQSWNIGNAKLKNGYKTNRHANELVVHEHTRADRVRVRESCTESYEARSEGQSVGSL